MGGLRRIAVCGVVLAVCGITQAAEPPKRAPIVNRSIEAPSAAGATRESLLQLLEQIEELQNQLRQLQNQVEVQTNELDKLKSRQRDLISDLDRRLRELESRAAARPSEPPAPAAGKTPGTEEQQAYDETLALLKQGAYESAIREFSVFLARYPDSGFADHVHYWMGESHYVLRNHKAALAEFTTVVSGYPNSQKLPDALFKIGALHQEAGALDQARKTWIELTGRYPNSLAAKLAQKRLQDLDQTKKKAR